MAPQPLPLSRRPLDIFFVLFFVLHALVSILIDGQLLLPSNLRAQIVPRQLVALVEYHVATSRDVLVDACPPWFLSFVACEIFLQVPFFVVATFAFVKGREWVRLPAVAYSSHAATTLVAIMTELAASDLPWEFRVKLLLTYLPFLVIPVMLMIRVWRSPLFATSEPKVKET